MPLCKNNVLPNLKPGEEQKCRVLPKCLDLPGGIPGETCHKGAESLAQARSRLREGPEEQDAETEEEATEAIEPLPPCNGKNGRPGYDCAKVKLMPLCEKNILPDFKAEQVDPYCRV